MSHPLQKETRSLSTGHVHFHDAEITPEHTGEITTQLYSGTDQATAHLGFLQAGRLYEISFNIPRYLKDAKVPEQPHPRINIRRFSPSDASSCLLVLELHARKEGPLCEDITFPYGKDKKFKLVLSAQVIGPEKGTPVLKQGVKLILNEGIGNESDFGEGGDDDGGLADKSPDRNGRN